MGRYVSIKRYKTNPPIYYYEVSSPDFPEINSFFIGIHSSDNKIFFYKNDKFDDDSFFIDISSPIYVISWLPDFLIYAVVLKAKEAMEKKQFNEYISFQS